MKTPTWANVIGFVIILFGVYQVVIAVQTINAVSLLEMIENYSNTNVSEYFIPDYLRESLVRFSFIGIPVSFGLIIGGIFLLIKKSFSIRLAYSAIALNLLFVIIQSVMLFLSTNAIVCMLVNITILIVIAVSDKTAYSSMESYETNKTDELE